MTPRKQQFAHEGFVLERVLADAEIEDFRRLMAELLDPSKKTASNDQRLRAAQQRDQTANAGRHTLPERSLAPAPRLASAVLSEISDDWETERAYLNAYPTMETG